MEKEKNQEGSSHMLAVVRVRGGVNLRQDVKETFKHLNLHNKNWCVFLDDNSSNKGMVMKVKDYVTWGEVTPETADELFQKRGELFSGRTEDSKSKITYDAFIEHNGKKYKRYVRLSPPRKGYGAKGVKTSFTDGGALGYRKEKIADLLKRMI